jgi:hypothetical protein
VQNHLKNHYIFIHFTFRLTRFSFFLQVVELVSSIHFNLGRCVTLKPLVQTKESFKEGGYSLILQHNMTTIDDTKSEIPPGWHIFIHEAKEPFTGELD